MTKRNIGARRASTLASQALRNLEVIIASSSVAERPDIKPGDHLLVDWSLKPSHGAIGATRVSDGVRFVRFDGDQSAAIGRLVNPSKLLQV
jgi:hypothetical protein